MRIGGLIRARNAGAYLPRLLTQMKVFCDGILLLDDQSEDDTLAIALSFDCHTRNNPPGTPHHEGRDRQRLHKVARSLGFDWIFTPDTDDLLEDGGPEMIRVLVEGAGGMEGYQFPYLYMIGDENHYRVDGAYASITTLKLFKYNPEELPVDREIHSMAVPHELIARGKFSTSEVRMKHLGYITPEQRTEKYLYYSKAFPKGSPSFAFSGGEGYEHILGRSAIIKELKSE